MSSGPFVVSEWRPGAHIKLVKNPHYYRAGEGRPHLDRVTFKTTLGAEMRPRLAEIFQDNMRECGIEVELALLPAEEFFADAPEGSLFGRRFDLALFAWPGAA